MLKKCKNGIKFLLFVLFLGYYSSITFFSHSHIVVGNTIIHSHPYKSLPWNDPVKHQHSKGEYEIIQFLTDFLITFATITFLLFVFLSRGSKLLIKPDSGFVFSTNNTNSLRAPPLEIHS